jgi:DinB family protein
MSVPMMVDRMLQDLLLQLDQTTIEVGAFRALSPAQLAWRPSPEKWSVAHCIDHLTAQNTPYEAPLARALDHAKPGDNRRPLKMGLMGRLLFDSVDPEKMAKRKTKTPPMFRPAPDPDLATLFERFQAAQRALRAALVRAQGVDAQSVKVSSPALRWLRFNVATALRVLVVHEERHLRQIRRVMALPDFPKQG